MELQKGGAIHIFLGEICSAQVVFCFLHKFFIGGCRIIHRHVICRVGGLCVGLVEKAEYLHVALLSGVIKYGFAFTPSRNNSPLASRITFTPASFAIKVMRA